MVRLLPSPVRLAWAAAFAGALLSGAASAADPQPGDARAAVVRQLGRPQGSLLREDQEILWYERGSIELTDGAVTLVKLMTPDQLRQQKRTAEERAREEAERQAALRRDAEAERDRMASDTNLTSKTASEQVKAWEEFNRRYPMVATDTQTEKLREQARKDEEAAQAQLEQSQPKPKPKLSASKRRRYRRAGDTNMVDIAAPPGDDAP